MAKAGFTRVGHAPPDRAAWALANIMSGSPDASVRALLAPDSLSPAEHQDLVDKLFGPGESLGKSTARFLTNPMTILGVALSVKWPLPTMQRLAELKKYVASQDRALPVIMRPFMGLMELFYGTGVDDIMGEASQTIHAYHSKFSAPLAKALANYTKATGAAEPDIINQIHMGLVQDAKSGYLDDMQAAVNKLIGHVNKLVKNNKIPNTLGNKGEIPLIEGRLADAIPGLSAADEEFRAVVQAENHAPQFATIQEAAANKVLKLNQRKLLTDNWRKHMDESGWFHRGEPDELPTQIAEHFPHQRILNETERDFLKSPAGRAAVAREKNIYSRAGAAAKDVTGTILERGPLSIPHLDQLEVLVKQGKFPEQAFRSLKQLKEAVLQGRKAEAMMKSGFDDTISGMPNVPLSDKPLSLPPMYEYDTRFADVMNKYTEDMARSYALNLHVTERYPLGIGSWLEDEARRLAAMGGQHERRAYDIVNQVVPALRGRPNLNQYMKALEWNGVKEATVRVLGVPTVRSMIGDKTADDIITRIQAGDKAFTWAGLGAKLSGYLFNSTIGFNPGAVLVNSLQPLLTTGAVAPTKHLFAGWSSAAKDLVKYQRYIADGLTEAEASLKAFPDFVEAGLADTPLFAEDIGRALASGIGDLKTVGQVRRSGFRGVYDAITDAGTVGFKYAERLNQLTAFRTFKTWGIADGLDELTAATEAAKYTRLTQQWQGPLATPIMIKDLWSPMRQFLTFPMKQLAFMGLSAGNYGGIYNPGTVGRAMVAATGAYELGRAAGVDLSRGLAFGATPSPSPTGPFAPLPVVPPLLSIGGALASDFASGELKETTRALPLAVPGGIQLARLSSFLPDDGAVSSTIGRPHIDLKNGSPDKGYPVYDKDGRLVRNATTWEVISKGIGLDNTAFKDEADTVAYVVRQRDEIRKYRQMYMEAMARNDPAEAQRISNEFESRYKVGPIQTKRSDWQALQERRQMTRMQRTLQGVPKEYQPLIGSAMTVGVQSDLERLTPMADQLMGY